MFDQLGVGNRAWSHKLGAAAMELLSQLVRIELAVGRDVVAEANFRWPPGVPPCRVVQIYCDAPLHVLMERIRSRKRHPGHLEDDPEHLATVEASLREDYAPLPLGGTLIEYSVGSRSVDDVVAAVRAALAG